MIHSCKIGAVILLLTFNASAQEETGCGEFVLRGVLKIDETAPFHLAYIINEGTKSKYRFTLQDRDDSSKLALMIDVPTTINVKITKPLDGYGGAIKLSSEISRRFSDPLNTKIQSMEKIKSMKCD